jgi:hypothetical protein
MTRPNTTSSWFTRTKRPTTGQKSEVPVAVRNSFNSHTGRIEGPMALMF